MSTVRFTAEIGQDQTIHPPTGIRLTPGKAVVVVVQSEPAEQSPEDAIFPPGVPQIAKNLVTFAHSQDAPPLPPDFALNHDHYLHGAPKGSDLP
jgi:hypothetical protein